MSYDQRNWPVFLSRARIIPLQEPATSRSPTTVGVENTQPPVSNSQRIWWSVVVTLAAGCWATANVETNSKRLPIIRVLMTQVSFFDSGTASHFSGCGERFGHFARCAVYAKHKSLRGS